MVPECGLIDFDGRGSILQLSKVPAAPPPQLRAGAEEGVDMCPGPPVMVEGGAGSLAQRAKKETKDSQAPPNEQ